MKTKPLFSDQLVDKVNTSRRPGLMERRCAGGMCWGLEGNYLKQSVKSGMEEVLLDSGNRTPPPKKLQEGASGRIHVHDQEVFLIGCLQCTRIAVPIS